MFLFLSVLFFSLSLLLSLSLSLTPSLFSPSAFSFLLCCFLSCHLQVHTPSDILSGNACLHNDMGPHKDPAQLRQPPVRCWFLLEEAEASPTRRMRVLPASFFQHRAPMGKHICDFQPHSLNFTSLQSSRFGPHLNPVTINPVIRMSCLGRFFCPRDSKACPSNSEPGAYNPLF